MTYAALSPDPCPNCGHKRYAEYGTMGYEHKIVESRSCDRCGFREDMGVWAERIGEDFILGNYCFWYGPGSSRPFVDKRHTEPECVLCA